MREVTIVGAGMTPFAEHFSLGIKDLLPMAFAECAASVDKGLAVADIQAAWFGELSTTDGFPSGILAPPPSARPRPRSAWRGSPRPTWTWPRSRLLHRGRDDQLRRPGVLLPV